MKAEVGVLTGALSAPASALLVLLLPLHAPFSGRVPDLGCKRISYAFLRVAHHTFDSCGPSLFQVHLCRRALGTGDGSGSGCCWGLCPGHSGQLASGGQPQAPAQGTLSPRCQLGALGQSTALQSWVTLLQHLGLCGWPDVWLVS